jgi:hypothetical protein
MQTIREVRKVIPYRGQVTLKATFLDNNRAKIDPEVVELDIGSTTYTLENGDIDRVALGVYSLTWAADNPGEYKRVWAAKLGDLYIESPVGYLVVQHSNRG